MNVSHEIRRAMRDGTADLVVHPDVAGLGAALVAADRRRRRRTITVAAVVVSALVVGAVAGAATLDDHRGAVSTPPAGRAPRPEPGIDAAPTPAPVPEPAEAVEPAPEPVPAPEPAPAATNAAPLGEAQPAGTAPSPPAAPPGPPASAPGALTAVATFGSCGEDPPYDDYSGTAPAGALVKVVSPYSAPVLVTADAAGHWATRVHFPSAPVGVPFTVTVASPGTNQVQLTFTRTA
jgi:hypothetical protein